MNTVIRVVLDHLLYKLDVLEVSDIWILLLVLLAIKLLLLGSRQLLPILGCAALPLVLLLALVALARCPTDSHLVANDQPARHHPSPFDAEPGSWR